MNARTVSGTNQAREERQGTPLKYIAGAAVAAALVSIGVTIIAGQQPGMAEKLAQCGFSVTSDVANMGTNLRLSGHGLEARIQVGADGRVGADTPVQVVYAVGPAANLFYQKDSVPAGAVLDSAIASGQCASAAYTGTGGR